MVLLDKFENNANVIHEVAGRGRHVQALGPDHLPLVSVMVRSMDRAMLQDALDSVALQSYANVEVVVVNAKGGTHSDLGATCGRFPLRLVHGVGPLRRAAAANLAMQSARGQYLIFLDDDDFFLVDHLKKLSNALTLSSARACYTGVQLVGSEGQTTLVLDEPWDADRLRGANFLPIHAVLFERSFVDQGCRFRDDLECLEDWEFWLQLAAQTPLQHVPGVSAVYRTGLGTSGLSAEADAEKHIANRARIFESWLPRFTSREWVRSIHWFENARSHFYQMALDRYHENKQLECLLAEGHAIALDLRLQLAAAEAHAVTMRASMDRLNRQRGAAKDLAARNAAHAESLQRTIEELFASTSWRATGLLRFVSRLARGERQQAMDSVRRRMRAVAAHFGVRLDRAPANAVAVLSSAQNAVAADHFLAPADSTQSRMVDMDCVAPLEIAPSGRIAVHAHIFYADVIPEFADYLSHMPFAFDLFVSVPSDEIRKACEGELAPLPTLSRLKVVVVPNRGRDVAPLFCTFGDELRHYDFLAHIHTKKSLYNDGATVGWREYLMAQLFGSVLQIQKIFTLLTESGGIGLVYPQNYSKLPYWANTWLSNRATGHGWCERLGIEDKPNGYFDYPAGSMFWARKQALAPLFDAGLTLEDFPPETGQQDATLAHCLERLFALANNLGGYTTAILRDAVSPRSSAWGFEQYLAQTSRNVREVVAQPDLKVVVFDIFDTLLLRPLLNPESTKAIVAHRAGAQIGAAYLRFRAAAESMARQQAGHDVGLDAIFEVFKGLANLPEDVTTQLRQLEECVEHAAVAARPDVVAILQFALSQGKRVVLASDMYLPRSVIESMLTTHGIVGWHRLYLSSDVGLRKDSGEMYRHILAKELVTPDQILMVGDNEHSDVQVPGDMGMKVWHVMRPVEMARAATRLGPLVKQALAKKDLNEELTLGLLLRSNLAPVFYSNFSALDLVPPSYQAMGYTVLGPLVLSFVQWLSQQAAIDGIERVYFLSREGEFLQKVYDIWAKQLDTPVPSQYLVLSRRAVSVPMIHGIEEIEAIARTAYFENHVSSFVFERYGVVLTEGEWASYERLGLLGVDRQVEVVDAKIDHLKPLLTALMPRILAQANAELPGVLAYLDGMGLNGDKKIALVDVGYSATIQGRLNQMLGSKVHGYYMVTDSRARPVAARFDVIVQGCFGQYVPFNDDATALLRQSFDLEKLLSSDEGQIVRYSIEPGSTTVRPEVRALSRDEVRCQPIRAEIRKGALQFVDDALSTRKNLLEDFVVPQSLGRSLYEVLVKSPSEREVSLLREMVLDDYYCGRDLVS